MRQIISTSRHTRGDVAAPHTAAFDSLLHRYPSQPGGLEVLSQV